MDNKKVKYLFEQWDKILEEYKGAISYEKGIRMNGALLSCLQVICEKQQEQIEDLQSEIKQLWQEAMRVKTDCKHED